VPEREKRHAPPPAPEAFEVVLTDGGVPAEEPGEPVVGGA
jgi:hypothetical protein